jgi:serine protease
MATPHVAGVVALMLSKNSALTPDQVATALKGSTRPFPATCSQCGTGIVDASAAVDAAGGNPPPPPGNEVEPNNSISAPQSVTIPITINGTMVTSSDTDYFKVSVGAGKKLTATLTPNASSDYDLYIYNAGGTQVASSIKGTGQIDSTSVTNTGASAANYYVRVRFYSGGTGATNGKYTLNMN